MLKTSSPIFGRFFASPLAMMFPVFDICIIFPTDFSTKRMLSNKIYKSFERVIFSESCVDISFLIQPVVHKVVDFKLGITPVMISS